MISVVNLKPEVKFRKCGNSKNRISKERNTLFKRSLACASFDKAMTVCPKYEIAYGLESSQNIDSVLAAIRKVVQ